MKRALFALIATVTGLIALLSFKSHDGSSPAGEADSIPSAVLTAAQSAPPLTVTAPLPALGARTTGSRATTATARPSASARSSANAGNASRTILGSTVTTRYGIVQVRITVSGQRITSASMAQLTAFDGHSAQINSFAAPILLSETIKAQDANIDTVSGATYTSDGYLQSLQQALDQAAKP